MSDARSLDAATPSHILLVGAPGVGKSTVGAAVAAHLGREFRDTDALIAALAGQPIADIFATRGEAHFRALERTVMAMLARELREPAVIAVGGGAPQHGAMAYDLLASLSRVYWLRAAPEVIAARLSAEEVAARPLFAGDDALARVRALSEERERSYAAGSVAIDTEGRTPADIAADIAHRATLATARGVR